MDRLRKVRRRRPARRCAANPPVTVDVAARRDACRQLCGRLVDMPWRAGGTWRCVRGIVAYCDGSEVAIVTIERRQVHLPLSSIGRPIEVWEDSPGQGR